MESIFDIRTLQPAGPVAATIGNFDGIHRGHQVLLGQVVAAKQTLGTAGRAAFITFDPHPLAVLRPQMDHRLLTTPQERVQLAGALGIDLGIIHPFTHETAAMDAAGFMRLLVDHLGLAHLVVGPDFALGRNRSGTLEVLRALGEQMGYGVTVIEPVDGVGGPVRSNRVRQLLDEGDVATAAALLDRPYHVTGVVVEGDRRGRQIGVPTANLRTPPEKLWPANGVYATRTWLHEPNGEIAAFDSATNIGVRPTVDGTRRTLETHILDFPRPGESGDLYGATITVEFMARLRGEQRFSGLDALVAQIRADVAEARERLARLPAGEPPRYAMIGSITA